MNSIFLDDKEYVFSDRFTDVHFNVIEKAFIDPSNMRLMSEAGFLLKFVVFTEKLPNEYIEMVEERYIVFFEFEQLIDIYKTLQLIMVERQVKTKQSSLDPESEEYKQLQLALDNVSKIGQSLSTKDLIEIGKKQENDKESIALVVKKALKDNNQDVDDETLNKMLSQI